MIRFVILFITRMKHFSCCFLCIVRVYPIDTTNRPLHEWQSHSTVFTQGRAAVPPGNGIPDERAPARTAGGIEEYFHRVVQFSAPGGSSTRPGRGVGSISGCACPRIRSSGCKVFNLNIIQSEPPRTDIYLFAFGCTLCPDGQRLGDMRRAYVL